MILCYDVFLCFGGQVLTRDSVTVAVDAVVYYRIKEPLNAVVRVADYRYIDANSST